MSSITSAGVASGIDFESIITASVEAKKQQLNSKLTTNKQNSKLELTGVGLLKSNLSTFKDLCDKIGKENSFNKRSVTIKQDATNPVFTCETKDDASNGNYNIAVTQLAQTTTFSTSVADSTAKLGAGTLKFAIGSGSESKSFSIEVEEDDTLETLRNKINSAADSFGVTANILTLEDGTSKFVLDSGNTGDKYRNFRISAEGSANLNQFQARVSKDENGNLIGKGNMDLVQIGQDAKITVDGAVLTSDNNVFDDKIKGLKITVNRLSDTQTVKNEDGTESEAFKSNSLSISTDVSALKTQVQDFLNLYNELRTNLDNLSKRNTYTDGKCNDDGGYLAGDSTCTTIKSMLSNVFSSFKIDSSEMDNLFSMGIKMDNDGNLSLDSTKFEEALKNNYEQVVLAFSGEKSVTKEISNLLEDYTKSGGILALREDSINSDLRSISQKESSNAVYLAKYEESLRAKYANLDVYIGNMNTSLSYLSSALMSSSNQSSQ